MWWPFKKKPKFRVIYLLVMDDHGIVEATQGVPTGPRCFEVTEYPAAVPAPEGMRLRMRAVPKFRQVQLNEGMVTVTWPQIRFYLEKIKDAEAE